MNLQHTSHKMKRRWMLELSRERKADSQTSLSRLRTNQGHMSDMQPAQSQRMQYRLDRGDRQSHQEYRGRSQQDMTHIEVSRCLVRIDRSDMASTQTSREQNRMYRKDRHHIVWHQVRLGTVWDHMPRSESVPIHSDIDLASIAHMMLVQTLQ